MRNLHTLGRGHTAIRTLTTLAAVVVLTLAASAAAAQIPAYPVKPVSPRQPDALLQHAAAEVSVDQAGCHFLNGLAQDDIGQRRLAHPSLEVASLEHSRHEQ